MKKFKELLTICLIASLAVTAFGCSSESSEPRTSGSSDGSVSDDSDAGLPDETISLEKTKTPLTFVHVGSDEAEGTEAGEENEQKATETQAASAITIMPVTEVVNVTDAKGQPATDTKGQPQTEVVNMTEVVKVTDAAGQPATDAKGQEQTEAVNVTETAVQPATLSPDAQTNNYTPSYDTYKTYWLDMSQESDFFFDGEFLTIEFEINADAPDGLYPVTIENPDIASWELKAWTPKIIAGQVAVNSTPDEQEALPESDFGLKVNSVSAKPGDTVTMTIDLKNNPGFCGFVLEVKYDAGAMKILEINGGEDFNNNAVNYVPNN